jgi:hypothetical protein
LREHSWLARSLVVRELSCRQVAGTSELPWPGDDGGRTFDWLCDDHAANLLPTGPPDDFSAEDQ